MKCDTEDCVNRASKAVLIGNTEAPYCDECAEKHKSQGRTVRPLNPRVKTMHAADDLWRKR